MASTSLSAIIDARLACTFGTSKRCAKACPFSSELPRHATMREPGLFFMPGATKSQLTQPKPMMPQRRGDAVLMSTPDEIPRANAPTNQFACMPASFASLANSVTCLRT
jgi:hypothetical protein